MILYILISLFLILILWILFAPIILSVDTASNIYKISLPGVLSARVIPSDNLFFIRIWIFFIPIRFDPFKSRKRRKRNKEDEVIEKAPNKKRRKLNVRTLLKRISKAFKIKNLNMNIDTDDFMLNAWLIPAFSAVNTQKNIQMQVNFEGVQYLNLDLRTRVSAILWLIIKMKH